MPQLNADAPNWARPGVTMTTLALAALFAGFAGLTMMQNQLDRRCAEYSRPLLEYADAFAPESDSVRLDTSVMRWPGDEVF
jgi:hypothetical protein